MTKQKKLEILEKSKALKESDLRYVLGYATACLTREKPEKKPA